VSTLTTISNFDEVEDIPWGEDYDDPLWFDPEEIDEDDPFPFMDD
jgi:hypothetical protein